MNTKLSKEEWEAKQDILTNKTVEYTHTIRQLSDAYYKYDHSDQRVLELKQKKKELWAEIQSLAKELGYPSHDEEEEDCG